MKINPLILSLGLALTSCTNPVDEKISKDNAYEYLDKICKERTVSCSSLKEKYSNVLAAKESGNRGRAWIAREYGKTFEQLTFQDLIDN